MKYKHITLVVVGIIAMVGIMTQAYAVYFESCIKQEGRIVYSPYVFNLINFAKDTQITTHFRDLTLAEKTGEQHLHLWKKAETPADWVSDTGHINKPGMAPAYLKIGCWKFSPPLGVIRPYNLYHYARYTGNLLNIDRICLLEIKDKKTDKTIKVEFSFKPDHTQGYQTQKIQLLSQGYEVVKDGFTPHILYEMKTQTNVQYKAPDQDYKDRIVVILLARKHNRMKYPGANSTWWSNNPSLSSIDIMIWRGGDLVRYSSAYK